MVNHNHYTYRVTWSQEDQEFVGLCAEFPSLSYLHEDTEEIPPEPLAQKQYSGKFQVRITPALHRKLAIEAAEEKVSLNRYISYKLS
jgi:predicted HicB family RNase H-like nuclease